MQLIELIESMYKDLAGRGLRASAWIMDEAALAQLRREAAAEYTDVPSMAFPLTFLGVPIEIVPMQPGAQADFIRSHRRFAPCQRRDRPRGEQWDVFNLDAGEALNKAFASKEDAEEAAARLDRQ